MSKIVPIVITILECQNRYLFIQRKNPPYEGLWSMIGGKINTGEHITEAAIREVMEETGTQKVDDYIYRGLVSERLVDAGGTLLSQFLIFVGHAIIAEYTQNHREGALALFSLDEIHEKKDQFLPSDYEMFQRFLNQIKKPSVHEVELLHDDKGYHLVYYRERDNASQ
ncbi:MAG: NUDIX domain-containing protein [Candidatus Thorarchaeota archaeon]|nr:MAG: NUDIX domain-containing protein [Candidatus Thorarchaeota archaeon]